MPVNSTRLTRRRLLGWLGSGTALAAAAAYLPGRLRSDAAPAFSDRTLDTMIAFMGTLFGDEFDADDVEELKDRLRYSLEIDAERRHGYAILAQHLDQAARATVAADFAGAPAAVKAAILDEVMRRPAGTRMTRILARLSADRRDQQRMRDTTVPALAWLYSNSGVPWRRRGYRRWPGIPGDWREVLAEGPAYA